MSDFKRLSALSAYLPWLAVPVTKPGHTLTTSVCKHKDKRFCPPLQVFFPSVTKTKYSAAFPALPLNLLVSFCLIWQSIAFFFAVVLQFPLVDKLFEQLLRRSFSDMQKRRHIPTIGKLHIGNVL